MAGHREDRANREDYVLGKNITEAVASKKRDATAVLSVRLSAEEVKALEAVSAATGRTMSQVAREALKAYLHRQERIAQPTVTISAGAWSGFTSSTGSPSFCGSASKAETWESREKVST